MTFTAAERQQLYRERHPERCREAVRRYQLTDKGRERIERYKTSRARKEALRRYNLSEKGKAADARYQPSTKNKAAQRKSEIKRIYGITPEQFNEMAAHGCRICGRADTPQKHLHVDHCHKTGVVRGLLCDQCNRGLGFFGDDTEKLQKAVAYLKERGNGSG